MPAWPQKTRELHSHHFDSTIWNDFHFRDDDIVIATYAQSGTTWVQQLVGPLLFGDRDALPVAETSPWQDPAVPPQDVTLAGVSKQTQRHLRNTTHPVHAHLF